MNGDSMEINQIKYFLEVANSQHMTASAEKLHIAQPALSQSIRRFEKSLGVPLFQAKGRNIVLTEYGKYLQEQLIPIVEQLDKLPETLQTMAKLNGETIHLNVLAASTLVTGAIIDYKSQHKDLNFQLLQNIQSEAYDIEITTKSFHKGNPKKIHNQFICTEKIFIAVPNNKKYKGRTSISLKEIEKEGFISLLGSRQFRYICDNFCTQAQIQPKIIFESDSPEVVKNMIAANLGVGFWPEFTWGKIESENVRLLEITDPVCSREIVITVNKNKVDNENVEEFFEYLKKRCITQKTAVNTRTVADCN